MFEISSHGCSFLGRFYLEIEKQGLSSAERRDDLQAADRQRAYTAADLEVVHAYTASEPTFE
jgi:hypothetical protein